jgi:hydroxymethylpyrimidine/phosphomethylpyrimidine kinase
MRSCAAAVLTIAGSDSGGGAGIQADLRTFAAHGVLGCTAITAITVQNTCGVKRTEHLAPELVAQQIKAVLEDLPVRAIKTGMLGTAAIVEAVADALSGTSLPLVVDPVLRSTSGTPLLEPAGVERLLQRLCPRATVITPNLREAAQLAGCEPTQGAERILKLFAEKVPKGPVLVMTGGEAPVAGCCRDLVRMRDGSTRWLQGPHVETRADHGTGCTFSAAIAARLALGRPIDEALDAAKTYLNGALKHAEPVGAGHGPINHLWRLHRESLTERR